MSKEYQIEDNLIELLKGLKYVYRPDIVDRKTLEQNFKIKFEALNRVRLTDNEFLRLREEIINPDVFAASKLLRERQKHKEEQQRLAYMHQLELEKSEKELMKLKNEKLETEIEFKNTELASTAMHLVQKEEFLLKIKEELHHLNNNGKEKADGAELKKILRILSEEEKLNEEWEQFSVHFDKVHGDFLIRLKEKYPSLKPHELKLCAYLRMNLSSKEIARLMSISVRGVEISRYRLRKKLEIPTETNLFQFLFDLQRNDFKT